MPVAGIGQFPKKARRFQHGHIPRAFLLPERAAQIQTVLTARNGNIEKPALLFFIIEARKIIGVGETTLNQPDKKYH